jgi:hypothetical protein
VNRADRRRQEREIDKMMKAIQSLTPTQTKAVEHITNEKSAKMATAMLVSFQRVINAALIEHGLNYSEIEEILNKASYFMQEEDEKSYKLNEELKRSGDIEMAKKKIEKDVLELINAMLDEGKKKKEIIDETLFKFPNMSKAMIINAYQEAKENKKTDAAVEKIMDIIEAPKEEPVIEEKAVVKETFKTERIAGTSEKIANEVTKKEEDKPVDNKLKILSMTVEGENGKYKVCEKGVELQNKGLIMFFENIEQLENFTEEYKQVFKMVK